MTQWISENLDILGAKHKHLAQARAAIGPLEFQPHPPNLNTLASLIIQQQISVKAAAAINARMDAALGKKITPADMLAVADEDWRTWGLSQQKITYMRDLAAHVADGRINLQKLNSMSDDDIMKMLIPVKGIGRWTVENFLIFALQRPNVWPAHDLALQEGMKRLRKLPQRPKPKEMDKLAEKYVPYRSAAALLVWASLEQKALPSS